MKRLLVVFCAVALVLVLLTCISPVQSVDATITVTSDIFTDTTWTKANSPYIISSGIRVVAGVTLNIEPGVEVRFDTGRALQIDGELVAQGTDSEPIIFTSSQPLPVAGNWGYILFTNISVDATYDGDGNYVDGSIMQYCTIEYAGYCTIPALRLESSSPLIDHCNLTNNVYTAIYSSTDDFRKITNCIISNNSYVGIYIDHGEAFISGNIIFNNVGSGIHTVFANADISENTIYNNLGRSGSGLYSNSDGGGICAAVGSWINIHNNNIFNNSAYYGGGIFSSEATVNITANVINDNYGEYGGGGIYTYDSGTFTIDNNNIVNNSAGNGGGIYLYSYPTVTVINNSITDNFVSAGEGKAGGIYIYGHPTINNNNIHNNAPYNIYNSNAQGTTDVDATSNWWNTIDDITIQTSIWDWKDDSTFGIVNYAPYRNTPALVSRASFNYLPYELTLYRKRTPAENEPITFYAYSYTSLDGPIVDYGWDFGDGNIGSGKTVTHTYATKGSYAVTLTVTNSKGTIDSVTRIVEVVPDWRKDVRSGDLVFDPSFLGGIGHIGICYDPYSVVEAIGSWKDILQYASGPGVVQTDIQEWDNKNAAFLLRVNCSDEVAHVAACLALGQVEKPYQFSWLSKSSNMDSLTWYCSELVWAVYKNQGINLEYSPDSLGVAPVEIYISYNNGTVSIIGNYTKGTATSGISTSAWCPVDLVLTDPSGLTINRTLSEIPDAIYMIDDINDDGSPDTWIGVPESKVGTYLITVVPQAEAQPTDTYTLTSHLTTGSNVLAENVSIEDIPVDPYAVYSSGEVVTFPDPSLDYAVRTAINKSTGDIYQSDLDGLTSLNASFRAITDLTGIEHCTNLVYFNLEANYISDISLLSSLANIEYLDISNNNLSDIDALTGLEELRTLYLDSNQIVDIIALEGLTHIGEGGSVFPLPCRQYNSSCIDIGLSNNKVTDIEPLVNNSVLGSGDHIDLRINPLSATSIDINIPELQGRGVIVDYSPIGDLTGDSHVNVLDMIRIGQRWGQTGAPGWIYEDVKPDGVINVLDMILIGQHWTG